MNPLNRFLEDRGFLGGLLEVVLRGRVVTSKPCCCIKPIKNIISVATASINDLMSMNFKSIGFTSSDFSSIDFMSIHLNSSQLLSFHLFILIYIS